MNESKCVAINPDDLNELFAFCNNDQLGYIRQYGMDQKCRVLVFRIVSKEQSRAGVWVFPSNPNLPVELFDRYKAAYAAMKTTLNVDGTPLTDINYIENTAMTLLDIFSHPELWDIQKDVAVIAACAYDVMMTHAEKYNPETLNANIVSLQLDNGNNRITHSFINFTNKTVRNLQ